MDKDKLQKALDEVPRSVKLAYGSSILGPSDGPEPPEVVRTVAVIEFSEPGFGFGEIAIIAAPEGTFIDAEMMSRERVKGLLNKLVDDAIFDTEEDPERHKLYNRVRGQTCGGHCKICHG